ncbi:MAG: VWA domain-containing protein [Clostridiales bacterium]|nr:VWA domain-containing protein [Clostridiales bacterium]
MKKGIPRRILTAVLSLAMVLTLLPAAALAVDDTGETSTSGIELSKTATLEDDGTYTIDLEAYATGTTTTTTTTSSVPLDIVLVIDQSGSMTDSITTSTSYTARDSQGYTYSNLSSSWGQSAPTYYYLAEDGNYYQVKQGSQSTGSFFSRTTYYYLYYTDSNGNNVYLSGTGTTSTQPTNVTSDSTTIWTGILYTVTSTTTTKLAALKDAVTSFVSTIQEDAEANDVDHRIAIVGFASDNNDGTSGTTSEGYSISSGSSSSYWINTGLFIGGSLKNYGSSSNNTNTQLTTSDYQSALVSVNSNGSVATSITTAIDNFAASGGTRTSYGMKMAEQVFANNSASYTKDDGTTGTRKRIVVVFTDGQPGTGSSVDTTEANSSISSAYTLKNTYGATVYSVGLYTTTQDTDVTTFMNYISSNYPNATSMTIGGTQSATKYSMTASNATELNNIFQIITEDVSQDSTTVTLDAESVMKDIMGDGFTLPNDFTVEKNVTIKTVAGSVNADTGKIEWGSETENEASASVNGNTVSVTGFNYADKYISSGHAGEKICVTITNVLPTESVTTGDPVYTNDADSGIYATADAEEATATFEQPQTIITKKLYVLDYAKTATLTDLDQSSVTSIVSSYQKVSASDEKTLTLTYGTSALATALTYTPTTMQWSGYDSFYVFGRTTNSEVMTYATNTAARVENGDTTTANLWSKVSVIPANNVYYEDDFITTSTDGTTSTGTVGIVYTGEWQTVGESAGNTETANNDTYGWETTLANDIGDSDGASRVSSTDGATASFTFTGTGVDIYSRTDLTTGTVYAKLTGKTSSGTSVTKRLIVDDLAESAGVGTYYQIPTVSFEVEYGTYTVTLTVTNQADNGERCTYYLDGIRVYNPLGNSNVTGDAYDAYAADNELNAVFKEVRDILINDVKGYSADSTVTGAVFIDEINDETSITTGSLSDYVAYGPKNEVYLDTDQAIVFKVDASSDYTYYLGLKSAGGSGTTVEFTKGSGKSETTISHSTDLYYEVTPDSNGYIMVKNTGESLLSITKLRTTTTAASASDGISSASLDDLVSYANSFSLLSTVAYTVDAVTEDELDTSIDAETDTDASAKTDDVVEDLDEADIAIDNPTEDTVEETEENGRQSAFSSLFDTIRNWFNGRR